MSGRPATPTRPTLAGVDLLQGQMEPIHAAASQLLLLGLLPAVQVAWADGVVQDAERRAILKLAEDQGLARNPVAMARLRQWLEAPPTELETARAIAELKRARTAADPPTDPVVDWARAVARADGGVLGVGAISDAERRVLDRFAAALAPESDAPPEAPETSGARLAALEVMRDLLADRLACDTTHVEMVPRGVSSQWPQPSPWGAFAPAVLGVPESEYRDYMTHLIERYVRSLKDGWWDAVRLAATKPGVAPLTDGDLGRLMWGAPFSRLLCPTLDPLDLERFGPAVGLARRVGTPYKVDLSYFEGTETLDGLYVAATVGLFSRTADQLVPIAISVNGRVFRPSDGPSWERARYFLIQGCSITMVVGVHPHLHFPMDSVIGVSREVFPDAHPLRRLIDAHAWLQLPLNYGVLFNERSVAHNHQREVYTPFPVRRDVMFHHWVSQSYEGLPGNSGMPGFRYPMAAPSFPGPYCEFLRRYHEVVLDFCRAVVARVDRDDPSVATWGEALHGLLPGFPPPDALRDPEVLARVLAGFVHSVSIWHATEHHCYGLLPVSLVPQRLRVPPPVGDDPPIPPEQWVRRVDLARQEMSRRMFYEAHTVRPFLEADYGFTEPELVQAVAAFHDALRACDRDQPVRYLALDRIACSLQF